MSSEELTWVETKSGKIVEVHAITKSYVCGREIITTHPNLMYGEDLCLRHDEIAGEDFDGTEDDLADIFPDRSEDG